MIRWHIGKAVKYCKIASSLAETYKAICSEFLRRIYLQKQVDEEAKITCAKPTHPGPTQCTSIASGKKTGINSAGERKGKGAWKQNKTRLPLNNAEDS